MVVKKFGTSLQRGTCKEALGLQHKCYATYVEMYEDVEKAFGGGRKIPLRMLEHYFVNRCQFEDETLQSYHGDLWESENPEM